MILTFGTANILHPLMRPWPVGLIYERFCWRLPKKNICWGHYQFFVGWFFVWSSESWFRFRKYDHTYDGPSNKSHLFLKHCLRCCCFLVVLVKVSPRKIYFVGHDNFLSGGFPFGAQHLALEMEEWEPNWAIWPPNISPLRVHVACAVVLCKNLLIFVKRHIFRMK